ncbi:hypothetical protein HUU62_18850 [Rhodoferax sp. 4810]|nr:hypothetical protein [Rhodoferax jenense]
MVTGLTRPTTLAQYKVALESAEASQLTLTQELETTRKTNTQLSADLQAAKLAASTNQQHLTALQQSSQTELAQVRKDKAVVENQLASAQAQASQAKADATQAKTETTQARLETTQARAEVTQARAEAAKAQADTVKAQTEVTKAQTETLKARAEADKALAEAAKAQAAKAAAEAQASQQLTDASEVMNRLKLAAVAAADREVKLGAENTALRKQLEQANTVSLTVSDATEQLAQLRKQIDALVAENRRMAESRDQLVHDQQALATTIEGQKLAQTQAVDKARAEAQLAAQQQIDKLQGTLRLEQARLSTLSEQLQSSGKLEVLAPDQVGALMSGFLQQMEGGMPSLRLAEGELKLKLGLASSGQTQGFVILQPDARVDTQVTVHEVALKFDRSGALNLPVAKP